MTCVTHGITGRRGDSVGQMKSWKRTFPVTSRTLRVAHSGHPCVRWISGSSFSQKPTGGLMPECQCQHTDSGNSANTQLHSCHENSKGSFHRPHSQARDETPSGGEATHNTITVHDGKAHQAALTVVVVAAATATFTECRVQPCTSERCGERPSETMIPTMRCQEQSHLPPACPQPTAGSAAERQQTQTQTQTQTHPMGGEIDRQYLIDRAAGKAKRQP
jgi:hypothetical protein